ncbi:hypothetical protein LESZY_00700 [Brevundimonas phage vB_BpoS-Leszy]|nr:hypothetical protein LESZY_00700 [Brevundimonas phage vB_BpoS-Leszy]
MKLFQHKALGGAIVVTNGPRFFEREGGGHVVNRDCHPVATFGNDEGGRAAYRVFCLGLTSGPFAGSSLFDEDTEQYMVGDVGELAA